jgi:hypothetical protein
MADAIANGAHNLTEDSKNNISSNTFGEIGIQELDSLAKIYQCAEISCLKEICQKEQ